MTSLISNLDRVDPESLVIDFNSGKQLPPDLWLTPTEFARLIQVNKRIWMYKYQNNYLRPWDIYWLFRSNWKLPGQYPTAQYVLGGLPCFFCKSPTNINCPPIPYCHLCKEDYANLIPTQQHRHLGNYCQAVELVSTSCHVMTPDEERMRKLEKNSELL